MNVCAYFRMGNGPAMRALSNEHCNKYRTTTSKQQTLLRYYAMAARVGSKPSNAPNKSSRHAIETQNVTHNNVCGVCVCATERVSTIRNVCDANSLHFKNHIKHMARAKCNIEACNIEKCMSFRCRLIRAHKLFRVLYPRLRCRRRIRASRTPHGSKSKKFMGKHLCVRSLNRPPASPQTAKKV